MSAHPCPCCGHLSLSAPQDYELCPICSWEDDGIQLRWPMSAEGANGMSLVDAQRAYRRSGVVVPHMRRHVRRPAADEPLDEGWRPFDPAVDWTHPELDGARWPRNREALYYWRPTYWDGDVDRLPAPELEPTGGDRLVEHLREVAPEVRPLIEHQEWLRGAAAPMAVCRHLAGLVVQAYRDGDADTGLRLVTALLPALDRASPAYAPNCVCIGLLDDATWHEEWVQPFVEAWPAEVLAELRAQQSHAAAGGRLVTSGAALWEQLWATGRGRPVADIEAELRSLGTLDERRCALTARVMSDPRWLRHHPWQAVRLAWRHRRSQSPLRTLRWLHRPRFAG